MNMLKQEIMTERSCQISGSQALVEGTLKLPEGLGEIASVLEIAGQAEATETNAMDGRIVIDGVARFAVLYIDKKGEIGCFDAECRFSHAIEESCITADMQVLPMLRMGDISHRVTDGSSVTIRAELVIDVQSLQNQQMEIMEANNADRNVEMREENAVIPYLKAAKCVKSYVRDELRVPQSMPPVKQVLLSRGYAIAKNIHKEEDRIIIEGDLRVFIVYLSPDKNAPLQYLSETLPFGEIVADAGCSSDSPVFVQTGLERLVVDARQDNSDLLDISAVINICSLCNGEREVAFVEDMYDRRYDMTLNRIPIQTCHRKQLEPQKKVVRMGVEVPESAPEVARVLYAAAEPEITSIRPDKDRAVLEGVMRFLLCYTTADSGVKSLKTQVPFEADTSIPGVTEESNLFVTPNAEYAVVEGSGRELEAKCCLDIQAWELQYNQLNAVADVEIGEEAAEQPPGILVYFTAEGENLWDIAKKFRVRTDAFANANVNAEEPLKRGTKLILVRN